MQKSFSLGVLLLSIGAITFGSAPTPSNFNPTPPSALSAHARPWSVCRLENPAPITPLNSFIAMERFSSSFRPNTSPLTVELTPAEALALQDASPAFAANSVTRRLFGVAPTYPCVARENAETQTDEIDHYREYLDRQGALIDQAFEAKKAAQLKSFARAKMMEEAGIAIRKLSDRRNKIITSQQEAREALLTNLNQQIETSATRAYIAASKYIRFVDTTK